MGLGIMGQEALSETYEIKMSDGEQVDVAGIQFSIQDSRQFISPEGTTFSEVSFLINEEQDGDFVLMPDLEYYPKMEMLYARPAISSNLKRDIQIILNNWKDNERRKIWGSYHHYPADELDMDWRNINVLWGDFYACSTMDFSKKK